MKNKKRIIIGIIVIVAILALGTYFAYGKVTNFISESKKEKENSVEMNNQLKILVEEQSKKLEDQKGIIDNQNNQISEQNSQLEEYKKESDSTQALVKHEAECRQLYLENPNCNNPIYRDRKKLDDFNDRSEEHAGEIDKKKVKEREERFKTCQNLIAKCG